MGLFRLSWRNALSRKERSLFTILAIALGVGIVLATILVDHSTRVNLQRTARDVVGNADAEVYSFSDHGFSFEMVGIDPVAENLLHPLEIQQGAMLVAGDHKNVLLDASWAGQHNLGINSKISLFTASGPEDYVVKGLVNNSSFIQDGYGQVVFVTLDEAQQAFQLGAKVTQVSVGFKYQACSDANCPDNVFNKFRNNLKKVAIDDYSLRNNQTLVALQKDPFGEIEPLLLFFGMVPLLTGF